MPLGRKDHTENQTLIDGLVLLQPHQCTKAPLADFADYNLHLRPCRDGSLNFKIPELYCTLSGTMKLWILLWP